jgi:hypothetical protein
VGHEPGGRVAGEAAAVEEITGDPPRTFEEWAHAHSQGFANEATT